MLIRVAAAPRLGGVVVSLARMDRVGAALGAIVPVAAFAGPGDFVYREFAEPCYGWPRFVLTGRTVVRPAPLVRSARGWRGASP